MLNHHIVSATDSQASASYAFLVTDTEFDEMFARIKNRNQPYWSDPMHHDPNRINGWDDGRGVYFDDPDGHRLEIITRPYGSGGTDAEKRSPAGRGTDRRIQLPAQRPLILDATTPA